MWKKIIDEFMIKLSFEKFKFVHFIHIKRDDQHMIFVVIYADYLVLASSNNYTLHEIKCAISEGFDMTDMGQLKYFLGVDINQDNSAGKVSMRQIKFAKDLL